MIARIGLLRALLRGSRPNNAIARVASISRVSWCDGLVEGRLICDKYERNNLAMWIKHHPDAELVESTFGAFYQLKGYCIATGAGYGGCAYRRAKQVWYAVIKIDDAD